MPSFIKLFAAALALPLTAGVAQAVEPASSPDHTHSATSQPAATLDTNADGKPDAWDRDSNGTPDAWDTNADGKPDRYDTNGDGKPDSTTPNR
ncbi:hypothetical protein [Novosphingobium sp. JCM 18896]|uniref:hypothetical protein n=1 Tax=Novosphingobium sp. JCM 18896 TaxID=2989731 RepID=UPI00222352D7|nr:hypothetical protein [Novosphingobium sp. JCM 18896]MCW1428405.1 hypothetical protein [Novosphingobium sp. JCM 18896]